MPPIQASKLTELLLSRRKLFEKIVQHVASKKIQNSIQATGDRMAITPQQFGMQVGKTMGKQAFFALPTTLAGAGLGALTAPTGKTDGLNDIKIRAESIGRGAAKGLGTGVGATIGAPLGLLTALLLTRGKKLPLARRGLPTGVLTGAGLGGAGGYGATSTALGKPSWENKSASLLSALGGGLGAGVGGLAGGVGGGLMGAMTGGALGGGPGAGLGLMTGGALGLGAGAHLGGNIGASIGKKKKKKDDAPKEESAEKEEKSDESDDEEVKESAARVLMQLQKNA